jgi:hypothetical protein
VWTAPILGREGAREGREKNISVDVTIKEGKKGGRAGGTYRAQANMARGSSATIGRKRPTLSPFFTPMD